MDRPIIVLVDGGNSTGKGTVLKKLRKRILENGMTYTEIFQPYFPKNRKILLSGELSYQEEYDIFVKDRLAVHEIIHGIIEDNVVDVLLLDRSIISSLVYQAIIHDDYGMVMKINKDISRLYMNFSVDIGIHLQAEPKIIAERNHQSNKYDYRDSTSIYNIGKELLAYCIAWNTFLSITPVKYYMVLHNNTFGNLTNIVNEIDDKIIKLYNKKTSK